MATFETKEPLYPEIPSQPPVYAPQQPSSRGTIKRCFCFSLRTGCLIMGWLNIVLKTAVLVTFALIGPHLMDHLFKEVNEEVKTELDGDEYNNFKENEHAVKGILQAVFIAVCVILALSMLVDIVLLVGVYKKKPGFIKTYVIIVGIILCLSVLGLAKSLFSGAFNAKSFFDTLCSIIWMIFSMILAYSHRNELLMEKIQAIPSAGYVPSYSPPTYEP